MDEREELKEELEAELQWIKYRMRMLDIIEEKLFRMKSLEEMLAEGNLSEDNVKAINIEIKNLEEQVKALDSESKKMEDGKIL